MLTTTTEPAALPVPVLTRRLIFRRTQAAIDHTLASHLPDEIRFEAAWDWIIQAGRDLDRLAAHQRTAVQIRATVGGGS